MKNTPDDTAPKVIPFSEEEAKLLAEHDAELWGNWYAFGPEDIEEAEFRRVRDKAAKSPSEG